MNFIEHSAINKKRVSLIISLVLITISFAESNVNAMMMKSISVTNTGAIHYPIPEPGTPYKWLAARTQVYTFDMTRENYLLLRDSIHPKVIQYMIIGDWWEDLTSDPYWKYALFKGYCQNLCQWAHEDGIYIIIDWGNAYRWDVGIGNNQTLWKGHSLSFQWHFNDLLSSLPYPPVWCSIDSEWTQVIANLTQNTADLDVLKQICQKCGVKGVALEPIYRGYEWMEPFVQTEPVLWDGENYPQPGSPCTITDGDNYKYGFGCKIGILTGGIEQYWTADAVRYVFDQCDKTKNVGIALFDVTLPMLNITACSDFVPTINAEAQARGYITS